MVCVWCVLTKTVTPPYLLYGSVQKAAKPNGW